MGLQPLPLFGLPVREAVGILLRRIDQSSPDDVGKCRNPKAWPSPAKPGMFSIVWLPVDLFARAQASVFPQPESIGPVGGH
jgi:hypothetical protein